MARKKRVSTIKLTVKLTVHDEQALRSAAATLDREPAWVLGRLCRLAVGTIGLSTDVRCWLRGDTAFDVGLPGDQQVLMTIGNDEPAVVRVESRKTVAQNPPTLEEVAAYIKEKGYGFTAEEFCDHYIANSWKQASGLPLMDWHAACRNPFQRNWLERHPEATAVSDWGKNRPKEADEIPDNRTAELPLGTAPVSNWDEGRAEGAFNAAQYVGHPSDPGPEPDPEPGGDDEPSEEDSRPEDDDR